MEPLEFRDVADLINHSRTTEIELVPVRAREGKWSLFNGAHKVHTSKYPFQIVYLHSRVTRDEMENASFATNASVPLHVIFPATVDQRQTTLRASFPRAAGFWTPQQYLASFITDELQQYLKNVRALRPEFYINPRIETPSGVGRKDPNPLMDLLIEGKLGGGYDSGVLGILLAEPGQGKTYMSRHLAAELASAKKGLVPLFVDSSQWHTMAVEDQKSLWKTIAHSFRHFEAPIGWLEGVEDKFLRLTLKANVFRLIFDGFDEYILHNRGLVQPLEVLQTLSDLAQTTGTRILITSRTSFWNTNVPTADVNRFLEESTSIVYGMLPFDTPTARNYFERRFQGSAKAKVATQLFGELRSGSDDLIGRGFVLSLVADLIKDDDQVDGFRPGTVGALRWLMDALCTREVRRHSLPLTADDQVEILRSFAADLALGEPATSELLEFAVETVRSDLDGPTRAHLLEKLKIHPLLRYDKSRDIWSFQQPQIEVALVASQIARTVKKDIRQFVERLKLDAGARQDLSIMTVDLLSRGKPEQEALEDIAGVVRGLASGAPRGNRTSPPVGEAARLAGVIALVAIERYRPGGSSHAERTALLMDLAGPRLAGLHFAGTIARFDLTGVTFEDCRFERVTWANCSFDGDSVFRRCHLVGGVPPVHCKGFGSAQFDDCHLDAEAAAVINAAQVLEGRKKYSEEDLRADFESVLGKFFSRGGHALKSVYTENLTKGPIGASKHRDEVISALAATVIEEHEISGKTQKGYNIRPAAEESVKFFAANNVFTGLVREAFDRAARKIGLTPLT